MPVDLENFDAIPGYLYATCGSDSDRLTPEVFGELYHGAESTVEPAFIAANGLPPRGSDIDLVRHANRPPGYDPATSAFRGTVPFPAYPGFLNGAVDWAGPGGLVFEIYKWRGYDLTRLNGRVLTGTGTFTDTLMKEQEVAIPARVPKRHVSRIADVVANNRGQLIPMWREIMPWK